MPQPQSNLVLHYTESCNAKCAHCVVESGPERREQLPAATARAAIDAAVAAGLPLVVFSGGESLMYREGLLVLCGYAKDRGLRTRVVSNAYWARTADHAARMLEALADAGVDELAVSFDEFHLPFIRPDQIANLVAGSGRAVRSPWVLYAAVIRPEDESVEDSHTGPPETWPPALIALLTQYRIDISRCIAFEAVQVRLRELAGDRRDAFKQALRDRIVITWQTLVVGGRATRELAAQVATRSIDDEAGSACHVAGRQLTVPASARVYPCCSAWSNFGDHHFGCAAGEAEFLEAFRRIQADPVVEFIHDRGPGLLIRWLRARGYPLRARYTDICNMCEELFTRCSLDTLRTEVTRYQQAQWLDALLGVGEPGAVSGPFVPTRHSQQGGCDGHTGFNVCGNQVTDDAS